MTTEFDFAKALHAKVTKDVAAKKAGTSLQGKVDELIVLSDHAPITVEFARIHTAIDELKAIPSKERKQVQKAALIVEQQKRATIQTMLKRHSYQDDQGEKVKAPKEIVETDAGTLAIADKVVDDSIDEALYAKVMEALEGTEADRQKVARTFAKASADHFAKGE
jgi:glutamine amidotransferase PdxT